MASWAGFATEVIVSPTFTSSEVLMPEQIPHVSGLDLLPGLHFEFQHAYLVGVVFAARVEELHVVALAGVPLKTRK